MRKTKTIILIVSLVLAVGLLAGGLIRNNVSPSSSASRVSRPSVEGSESIVEVPAGVDPEGVYLYLSNGLCAGFSLQIDGETVIQDSDYSGFTKLVGNYCDDVSNQEDGAVFLLPKNEGVVTLTIGGEITEPSYSKADGDLSPDETKSGYRPLNCHVFYYDGTFDSYSARRNDTPVSITLPANVQFVCVQNENG